MIDRFIAGGVSENKKANKLLLVAAAPIAFDNVRTDRFHGAANLTGLLEHLELGQLLDCHAMHINRHLPRQLPNLKVPITHLASRIPHPVQNSSSSRTGVRS